MLRFAAIAFVGALSAVGAAKAVVSLDDLRRPELRAPTAASATLGGEGSFLVHYGNGLGLVVSDYVTAVPEPGQGAMMLLGLLAVAGFAGRRRATAGT